MSMRWPGLILFILLSTVQAAADDLLGPVEYLKLLSESKLLYNFLSEPSKTPASAPTCGRRDETTRVVVRDGQKVFETWTITAEAKKLLEEGEQLFAANQFEEAEAKYKAAIAADPQSPSAYYFHGDALLFGKSDAAGALEQYRKGIALDPTMPSGHFFASTALRRLNRADEAREEIILALTYHPAYEAVWKIAGQAATQWNAQPIVRHRFEPPAGLIGGNATDGIDIYPGPDAQWAGYALCKAAWAHEPRFAKTHPADGWSLEEERACVFNQVMSAYNMTSAKLEEKKKMRGRSEIPVHEVRAALPPLERHLFEVAEARLLDGYVLFEIIGQQCPKAMSLLEDDVRKKVDQYIRKYVIVGQ